MCHYVFHIKLSGRLVGQQQPWRSHHIRAIIIRHRVARGITSFVQPPHTSASNLHACAHHPSPSVTLLLRPSGAFSPISRANQGTRSEGFASLVTLCDLPHYNAGFPIDRHILLRPRNIPSHRLSMVQPITASAVHTSSSLFLSHNQFAETFHPCEIDHYSRRISNWVQESATPLSHSTFTTSNLAAVLVPCVVCRIN